MSAAFIAGITLSLISILHCIGMCGPLALLINTKNQENAGGFILKYHLGRLSSYISLGVVVSFLGNGILLVIPTQVFTIIIGILVILGIIFKRQWSNWIANTKIYRYFIKQFNQSTSAYGMGIANGLLPCGLVFSALGLSLLFASNIETLLFMTGFGIGTFPATMMVQGFSKKLNLRKYLTPNFSKIAMLSMALILIVRGLNLGIPYLSPKIVKKQNKEVLDCCRR